MKGKMNMLMGDMFWSLILQSDTVTRGVLIMLLVMSIFCWSLSLFKFFTLKLKNRQLKKAMKVLSGISSLQDLIPKAAKFPDGFINDFISQHLTNFKVALKFKPHNIATMSNEDWQMLHNNMSLFLDDIIAKEQASISLLSTSAQVAPLIGLFGTIWGLIHAFLSISLAKNVDITVIAPGIAEALVTTMAGILVAVPALVLFNYLQNRILLLEQNLMAISDKCFWIIRSVSCNKFDTTKASVPNMSYTQNYDSVEKGSL